MFFCVFFFPFLVKSYCMLDFIFVFFLYLTWKNICYYKCFGAFLVFQILQGISLILTIQLGSGSLCLKFFLCIFQGQIFHLVKSLNILEALSFLYNFSKLLCLFEFHMQKIIFTGKLVSFNNQGGQYYTGIIYNHQLTKDLFLGHTMNIIIIK